MTAPSRSSRPEGEAVLVLGGGGVSGIAWMVGLLAGLKDEGLDLWSGRRIIGTSAGATVAAQLAGADLETLFALQVDPDRQPREISPPLIQLLAMMQAFQACAGITDPLERRRRIGAIALGSQTIDEVERRAVIAGRLPSHQWPPWPLQLAAVDAATGELRLFDASSGVALVDAVAASCAVPGLWPAVSLDGRRYIDGGVRSADNADLALGTASVAILSPIGGLAPGGGQPTLETETAALQGAGADVLALQPDPAARSAMGPNALDPSTRAAAAKAGRDQGRREARALG